MYSIEAATEVRCTKDLQHRDTRAPRDLQHEIFLEEDIQSCIHLPEIQRLHARQMLNLEWKRLLDKLSIGLGAPDEGNIRRPQTSNWSAEYQFRRAIPARKIVQSTWLQYIIGHLTHPLFLHPLRLCKIASYDSFKGGV